MCLYGGGGEGWGHLYVHGPHLRSLLVAEHGAVQGSRQMVFRKLGGAPNVANEVELGWVQVLNLQVQHSGMGWGGVGWGEGVVSGGWDQMVLRFWGTHTRRCMYVSVAVFVPGSVFEIGDGSNG